MIGLCAVGIACRSPPAPEHADSPPPQPVETPFGARRIEPPAAGSPDAGRDAAPSLAALVAPGRFVALDVPSFRAAIVALPLGATSRRPIMVALHGNYDRPEWQCEVWQGITGGFPFILCPRGIPRDDAPKSEDRWTYGGLKKTQDELLAGIEALRRRFPEHVAEGPLLFTGFSLGAIYGARIVREHAQIFPRAVLTEGGYENWSAPLAKSYAKAGGERVLFACGQTACKYTSKRVAALLEREQVLAKVGFGGNIGHTYDGRVAEAIRAEWAWLLEGDSRWQPERQ